jgi:hypothetical protein
MRLNRWVIAGILGLAVLVSACGNNTNGGGGGTPTPTIAVPMPSGGEGPA